MNSWLSFRVRIRVWGGLDSLIIQYQKFSGCRPFNPHRSGLGPVGPPIFCLLIALKLVVWKIWKKYLFLTSCMGYVFAEIMYIRKRHFMLIFQKISDLSKKSRSIFTLPTDRVSPSHSYTSVPYHAAPEFWDLTFRVEEAESRNSKEKATITHIEYQKCQK